jgi:GNAT superfamily N-acetyltransferase
VHADEGPALAELRVQAMRESLEAVGRFDPVRARTRFLGSFEPAHTRAVVVAGQTAGFLVLRPDSSPWLLDHLYIAPAHQRQGLGAALLRQLFAEADQAQQPLRVGALKGSRSNTFYQRHGFELVASGEWDHYYLRQPQRPALPLPAHTCPLCDQPNGCAAARSGNFDTPCWCSDTTFSPALRARVPQAQRGQACICRACAGRGSA